MFMGSLMIFSGCFLYWFLKPPVLNQPVFQEDVIFSREPVRNSEGVAGCLSSQLSIR
jgi:hypothetical protein